MTEFTRAKNYTEFADNWKLGIPCYYTGWKQLKCDGATVYLERGDRSPQHLLIGERVGNNFVLYNHRPKNYASDLLKYWSWTQRTMPQLRYATFGKPKGIVHDSWLTNQLYEGLLTVATHLLHPDQSLEELLEGS